MIDSTPTNHEDIPLITLVDVLRPSVESASSSQLRYPKLAEAVARHSAFTAARQQRLRTSSSALEHDRAILEITKQQLLECALAIQESPANSDLPIHFTNLSIKIFGAPDPAITNEILTQELADLETASRRPNSDSAAVKTLRNFYELPTTQKGSSGDYLKKKQAVLDSLRRYFLDKYGTVLTAVSKDGDPERLISPTEMVQRFSDGVAQLRQLESGWDEWTVQQVDGGTMYVMGQSVNIGKTREPLTLQRLEGKFAHEVLVHAKRRVEAHKRQDHALASGLANYTVAEEGLCCLVEGAILDMELREGRERYLDIATALGLVTGKPITRQELFPITQARQRVFQHITGRSLAPETTWESVNRVYRGTAGNEHVGTFTKDLAYFIGQHRMVGYLERKLQTNSVSDVMQFLLAGKFDPLNDDHVAYLRERNITL